MTTVGIIANPRAGKDIRRLVAHGSLLDTQEKVYIVRRALLGLDSAGVEEVVLFPDPVGIGAKAIAGIPHPLRLRPRFLDMTVCEDAADSTRAAALMHAQGAACVIVIGGDGTNRVVAKGCGPLPLVPLSTGTNNAFPRFLESTLAGLAAGYYAVKQLAWQEFTLPTKRLNVYREGELVDIALVDVAVCDHQFIGARALWETDRLQELFLTQGQPTNIGMAAIGGMLHPIRPQDEGGLYVRFGANGRAVTAAIAPGLVASVHIHSYRTIRAQVPMPVSVVPSILALDGEREIHVNPHEQWQIELAWEGPRVLDVEKVLEAARGR